MKASFVTIVDKEEKMTEQAREIAAQCWCDEETKTITFDPILAEAVARRISAWMDTAAQMARNADFYRGLLDKCAKRLGVASYTADDGTVMDEPVRLKIPELIGDWQSQARAAGWSPPVESRLRAVEKCNYCSGRKFGGELVDGKIVGYTPSCYICHGTGTIERPLTQEELVEVAEYAYRYNSFPALLKSLGRVVMEDK